MLANKTKINIREYNMLFRNQLILLRLLDKVDFLTDHQYHIKNWTDIFSSVHRKLCGLTSNMTMKVLSENVDDAQGASFI